MTCGGISELISRKISIKGVSGISVLRACEFCLGLCEIRALLKSEINIKNYLELSSSISLYN